MQAYTIQELEDVTGVPRRTIHYYVRERLIPPPARRGRGATYTDEHRQRLVLVRALRRGGNLGLDAIRRMLDAFTPGELRARARRAQRSGNPGPVRVEHMLLSEEPPASVPPDVSLEFDSEGALSLSMRGPRAQAESADPAGARTWTRIPVAAGVEIHLRADIGQKSERIVRELARHCRTALRAIEPNDADSPQQEVDP